MGGAPQGAMCVASQIWQVVFASQTLQVFCLAFRKKAQYVVVFQFDSPSAFSFLTCEYAYGKHIANCPFGGQWIATHDTT
jgi:hypothetical protein